MKDSLASGDTAVPIINSDFCENIGLGILPDDMPEMFLFRKLNGMTAEATVIAWQVESAVGFAFNAEQQYIDQQQAQDLLLSIIRSASDSAWLFGMQMVVASFQKGTPIDTGSVAILLSHYLLNDKSRGPKVLLLYERLIDLMTFLQGLTYLGTSRVFGDLDTVARIQKTLLG